MVRVDYLIAASTMIGLTFGVCCVILYQMYRKWRFPIQTPVVIKRGDKGYVWDLSERARIVRTSSGKQALKLMKNKKNIKPPEFEYVSTNKGGKPVYPVYNFAIGQFSAVSMSDKIRMELGDENDINWAIEQLAENSSRYAPKEGTWDRIIKYFAPVTFAVMLIFFIIYFGGKFEIMANTLGGAATQLAVAMEKFAEAQPYYAMG